MAETRRTAISTLFLLALALAAACHTERVEKPAGYQPAVSPGVPGPPQSSPSAKLETAAALREDLAAERHPADGGGRAWLEAAGSTVPARAGQRGRWTLVYEAGPLGIAPGGWLFFQVSPFWGWSPPQVQEPTLPGYTEISATPPSLAFAARLLESTLLGIELPAGMQTGQRLRLVYGAGAAGATADRFAESGSPFWLAVDGDGNGVRGVVPDPPRIDVVAGPPARLNVTLPSTARPGGAVSLKVAALDARGNAGVEIEEVLQLTSVPEGLELPPEVTLAAADRGMVRIPVRVPRDGIFRIRAQGPGELAGESNPLVVGEGRRILWGDLHGHSQLSDGTGTAEEYFRYARDVAGLEVVALTDHDHWGMQPLATHPDLWAEIRHQVAAFHRPGELVTLLGYEWTSWVHGHRHVLYFDDDGEVLSSVDPRYEDPRQLWAALCGQPAMTFAHHSAGGPIATNWAIPPDPELEPVTEIVSVHGASEAADAPAAIYSPVAGNFVRDALRLGYRLGFIGSGDSHDGHPGLAHLNAVSGGLAAIVSEELTREGVLEALRARRVYATNGARIVLRLALAGHSMGSTVSAAALASRPRLELQIVATAPIEHLDLIRNSEPWQRLDGDGREVLQLTLPVDDLRAGDDLYVRVVQRDGGAAWSSPWWIVE